MDGASGHGAAAKSHCFVSPRLHRCLNININRRNGQRTAARVDRSRPTQTLESQPFHPPSSERIVIRRYITETRDISVRMAFKFPTSMRLAALPQAMRAHTNTHTICLLLDCKNDLHASFSANVIPNHIAIPIYVISFFPLPPFPLSTYSRQFIPSHHPPSFQFTHFFTSKPSPSGNATPFQPLLIRLRMLPVICEKVPRFSQHTCHSIHSPPTPPSALIPNPTHRGPSPWAS